MLGRLRPLFRLALGGRLGSGRQYFPWISLDDEVGAIRFLVEHDEISGPVNLAGPEQVTNAEFTRALAAAVGRPAPFVVPAFALRSVLGQMAEEMVLTGPRAEPAKLLAAGYPFRHRTLAEALRPPPDRVAVMSGHDVVIVGAGLAGLRAAGILMDAGWTSCCWTPRTVPAAGWPPT